VYDFHPFIGGWSNASMPSGHAAACGGVCGALIVLWPRRAWLWCLLMGALALTRVFVRAHYLSDVFVGFALGFVVALLVRNIPVFRESDRLTPLPDMPA
jgi:membrane-associated phospholipid phosphatase